MKNKRSQAKQQRRTTYSGNNSLLACEYKALSSFKVPFIKKDSLPKNTAKHELESSPLYTGE